MAKRGSKFNCPNCHAFASVYSSDTRLKSRRRRRYCECGCKFTTIVVRALSCEESGQCMETLEEIQVDGDENAVWVSDDENEITEGNLFTWKSATNAWRAVLDEIAADVRNFGSIQSDTKAKHNMVLAMKRTGKLR